MTCRSEKTPLLIHIGYPKALSTWLQTHLFKPEQGYVAIMDPVAVQLNLIDPTPFKFEPRKVQVYASEKIALLRPMEIPIISSEALAGNPFCGGYNARELADRICSTFPKAGVLIIIREQRAMIRSLYSSMISWGMPHSLKRILDPPDTRLGPQFTYDYLEYDRLVTYYQDRVGHDRVKVLPFESFSIDPAGFVRAIHKFSENHPALTAADSLSPLYRRRSNPGRTLLNLLVQRWLNYFLVSNTFNYAGLFKDSSRATLRRIKSCRRRERWFPGLTANWFEKGFQKKVLRHTRGRFAASNRRLEQLIGLSLNAYGYELTADYIHDSAQNQPGRDISANHENGLGNEPRRDFYQRQSRVKAGSTGPMTCSANRPCL